jgi:hypothetical protein
MHQKGGLFELERPPHFFQFAAMKMFAFLSVALLAFTACSGSSGSQSPQQKAFSDFLGTFYASLKKADSLAGVKVPVVTSPSFEKKWGAPEIRTSESGNYELNYANPDQPFDRFVIQGSPVPFPPLTKAPMVNGEEMVNDELTAVEYPQEFRTVEVAGRQVRWYQESLSGGADGAYYATEGFALTDDKGRTGYYRMVVESGNGAHAVVAKRFATAKLPR